MTLEKYSIIAMEEKFFNCVKDEENVFNKNLFIIQNFPKLFSLFWREKLLKKILILQISIFIRQA